MSGAGTTVRFAGGGGGGGGGGGAGVMPVDALAISTTNYVCIVGVHTHLGMAVGPVGMDTRGFRTHRIWIRVQKLTRGSYQVGYPKYIGSGMGKILYPRVSSGYPKYQYTSLNVLHPLKMCYIH
jgi:hypothetical protein